MKGGVQRESKQRKRGSYRCKHRNNVSRWLLNIIQQLQKKRRRKSRMYLSVIECVEIESRKTPRKRTRR